MSRTSRLLQVLIGVCVTLDCAATAPVTAAYGPGWPASHADAANSDYHAGEGASDLELAWSRSFEGMINLGATSDGRGRIYVTTTGPGCHLHAISRASGKTIWCSQLPGRMAVASAPLIDRDGMVYLADDKAMRSFDRAGRLRWTRLIEGVPLSAQFTAAGDLLFITHIGAIYILDRHSGLAIQAPHVLIPGAKSESGQSLRSCMRGLPACPIANTPAVDMKNNRVFFTFWAPGAPTAGLRAMRLHPKLEPLWANDGLPGGSASSPDLSNDGRRLYVSDNAGNMNALDAETGRIIWTIPIGYASGGSASVSPQGLVMPAGGRGAPLMAIADQGDSAVVLWRNTALNNFGVATQAAGYRAYPTVSTGRSTADLLIVDTRTGRLLDREPIPGRPWFTVGTTIDLDGTVYVATISGALHAFRPAGRAGVKSRGRLHDRL